MTKGLAIKAVVLVLGLLLFAAMPRAASADSFTLDGVALDSFSLGSGNTFSATMQPVSLLTALLAVDQPLGITIPNLFLDDLTTGTTYDFKNDLVTSDGFGYVSGYWLPQFTANVSYGSVSVVTPEPSALLLLALGIVALLFVRKRVCLANPA